MAENLRTLIVTVQNKPGVLFRISGLIRKRQFNIESLTVSHVHDDPHVSRFTIVVNGNNAIVERVKRQLNRLIDVLAIETPSQSALVSRELALVKIAKKTERDGERIKAIIKEENARILTETESYLICEATGEEKTIDQLCEKMKKYDILDFVRTGRTAMKRHVPRRVREEVPGKRN